MAYSPPTILSGAGFPTPPLPPSLVPVELYPPSDAADPVLGLRQALAAGMQPAASILHAAGDAARILTGASGVAIAVRTRGVVVCRARSGDIAPELGAPLDVASGISGECLRTANILVCSDAETDSRVDPQVCRALGIRSIVVVPLRGPTGIGGILEAFSTNPDAFGDEQINMLRELAEIAEAAYERECRARDTTPVSGASATRRQLISVLAAGDTSEILGEPSRKRRYWILGIVAMAALLVSGVLWLSWRDPTPETAASERPVQSPNSTNNSSSTTKPLTTLPKPEPGIVSRRAEPSRSTGLLRNAAQIQPDETPSTTPSGTIALSEESPRQVRPAEPESASEPPPEVDVAASDAPHVLSGLASEPAMLPALEARVSQGVTQGALIHRVEPTYPAQARMQRLAGSVVLDATVGADGIVKQIKFVSGPALLAAAAREAVRQWRYSPPLLNGSPIELQRRVTIVFTLP